MESSNFEVRWRRHAEALGRTDALSDEAKQVPTQTAVDDMQRRWLKSLWGLTHLVECDYMGTGHATGNDDDYNNKVKVKAE